MKMCFSLILCVYSGGLDTLFGLRSEIALQAQSVTLKDLVLEMAQYVTANRDKRMFLADDDCTL